jgi:hypothetical protein
MTDSTPREVETACFCAGSPHERDRFVLPAELPPRAGIAAVTTLAQVGEHGDAAGALIEAILYNGGIKEWNLVDEDGKPLPLTPDNVASRVTWQRGGVELANAVFQQYVNGKDLTPFGLATSHKTSGKSSRNGQTASSTSPKTRSSSKPHAPSA